MGAEICFDAYLKSLVSKYKRSQDCYTQTDATNLFDFGLMVQTIQEKKEHQESQDSEQEESKIERFPVLDGIRKYADEHVLLVGRPGSGKSTALQKLLVDEAQKVINGQASLIPVLIELRSWRTSYIALIKDFLRQHKLKLDEPAIDDLLFEGKLLLLVDGVNELSADDHARQDILTLRETNADTPMIFTTRVLGVGGDLRIEKKLEMLPLSEPQMRQFVQMRLPEQGSQMLQQLGDRLRKFGETPLLLSMLCDVFQKDGRIPANLGSAFSDFANLYDGKLKEHIPVSEQSRSWWSKLLPQLAFAMMPQDRSDGLRLSIPRSEAVDILTQFLDREKFDKPRNYAQQWLKDLLNHHLIQVKLVGTNEEIEFRHQLIQEYYAAEYVWDLLKANRLSDAKLQHSYLNYLDWTESLALMLELVKDEEQALQVVRLALEVDLRLGARLAGAVKYGFQEKTVGLLIQEIDKLKIPQLYAIELFGETKSDVAIKFLIQSFKDTNGSVRCVAAYVLGLIGSDKAVKLLIQFLNDTEYYVCYAAADALGKIGNDKAVESLTQALKGNDDNVRRLAVYALGATGSDKAVEPLIQSLKDTDNHVRCLAADALGKIGSEKVVKSLIQSLKDTDNHVRCLAAAILVVIDSNKVVELLIHALKDTENYVRLSAADALCKIRSEKVVKSLTQALNDTDDHVRWWAVYVLGKIRSDEAVETLIQALSDTEHYVRLGAAKALSEIVSDKLVEPLIQAPKNTKDYVRKTTTEALGEIVSDKAVKSLIVALKDADYEVQRKVSKALEKIAKDDRNLPTLTQQLPHLLTLIPTKASEEALSVITAIQARSKYYNYAIAQTPLPKTDTSNITSSGNTIVNIQSKNLYMSDTSKPNVSVNISGGQFRDFVTGDKTIHGDEIETQNNYYGADDTQQLANELIEILQGIVSQISDPTSEAGKEIITAAAMEEIENKSTLKDRLVAAFKAGAFEAIKKIAKNDFVEVFLTAFKAGLEAKPKK